MSEELAAKAEDTFKRLQEAGGKVSHIEHITDKAEAVKVISPHP